MFTLLESLNSLPGYENSTTLRGNLLQTCASVFRRRKILFVYYILYSRSNIFKKRKRCFWVHPLNTVENRIRQGDYDNLIQEMKLTDVNKFFNHLRMTVQQFETLLSLVGPKISKLHVRREPLSAALKLCITLR